MPLLPAKMEYRSRILIVLAGLNTVTFYRLSAAFDAVPGRGAFVLAALIRRVSSEHLQWLLRLSATVRT